MRSSRHHPAATSANAKPSPKILLLVFGGLLLVAIFGLVLSQLTWRDDPEPWLETARDELTRLLSDQEQPEQRLERARHAQTLLQRYRAAEGTESDTASLLLASAQLVLGQSDDARKLLDEFDPMQTTTPDLERTAVIAFRTGHFGLADLLIDHALSRTDHREATLRSAIEIRYDLGRDEDVIAHIEELRTLAPNDPRPLLALAYVYRDRGDWDHVVDATREFLRLQPTNAAEARIMLIDSLITLGTASEARQQYILLNTESPEIAEHYPLLEARLLNLEGDDEQALATANRVLATEPENNEALLLRGRILLAQGEFASAVSSLEELIRLDPANFEAHYLLGQAYSRTDQADKARHELKIHRSLLNARLEIYRLERRAGRNPDDIQVRRELAKKYRDIGVTPLADFWDQAADSAEASAGAR